MQPTVAYLSQGRLFVKQPDKEVREIESPFARQAMERQVKNEQLNGWKGNVWGSNAGVMPELSMWQDAGDVGRRRIRFKCIARGAQSEQIYYILDLGDVAGVFRYHLDKDSEYRLMHRNSFPAMSLACHASGELAISIGRDDGSIGIAFSQDDGRHWNHVAGGDSIDLCPAWAPNGRQVVFQSSAIGRNEQGFRVGQAPFSVETLNLETDDEPTELLEATDIDLMLPRLGADGATYFIRRPFKPYWENVPSVWKILMDIILFPVRLTQMLFFFLNFISVMFAGQPLAETMQQKPWQRQKQQAVMLWGRAVDTKRAMSKSGDKDEGNLVPKDWELVCRKPDNSEEVLARSVVFYDLCDDGSVVFTNGTKVYHRDLDGKQTLLCRGSTIDQLVVVD